MTTPAIETSPQFCARVGGRCRVDFVLIAAPALHSFARTIVPSTRTQHFVAGNGVAERCSEEYVRGKMGTRGHARKADSGCETVHHPRHPAVVVISAGDDRGDREHSGGVPRRKGTASKRRLAAIKESICKRPSRWDVNRSFPTCNGFEYQVNVAIFLPLAGVLGVMWIFAPCFSSSSWRPIRPIQ